MNKILIHSYNLLEGKSLHAGGNFYHVRYTLTYLIPLLKRNGWVVALLLDKHTEELFSDIISDVIIFKITSKNILIGDLQVLHYATDFEPHVYIRLNGQLPILGLNCVEISGVADLNFRWLPTSLSKRIYKEISYGISSQRSDLIVCVSNFTANDLCRRFAVPRKKTRCIYHGVSSTVNDTGDFTHKFGKYFVTFGHQSHKNVETVLSAMRALKNKDIKVNLVVVGRSEHINDVLIPLSIDLGITDRVFFIGRVADSELGALYRSSLGLLFLSRFEGFGLPIIEAMAAGCPVIHSTSTAIPEIAGGAGLENPTLDFCMLANNMETLMFNSTFRDCLIESGLKRSKYFSWQVTANKIFALIGDCVSLGDSKVI